MKQTLPLVAAVTLLALPIATGSPASAQAPGLEFPQASPAALVRDRFGLTTVEIEYARPGVKGRTIFGGLVPFGEVWRTGANSATKPWRRRGARRSSRRRPAARSARSTAV
jgi:hypothetical protein